MFPQTALLVDRAVPCSMLKYGGNAALLSASPDGAADHLRLSAANFAYREFNG